jgi:hypothetical protein
MVFALFSSFRRIVLPRIASTRINSSSFPFYSTKVGVEDLKRGDYIYVRDKICQILDMTTSGKARGSRALHINYRTLDNFRMVTLLWKPPLANITISKQQ